MMNKKWIQGKCVCEIGGGCGEDTVRLLKAMPKLIPSVQVGKLVCYQFDSMSN